jgi:hypothetical protein
MSRSASCGILGLVLAGSLACASQVETSWRDPSTTADSLRFHKLLVVAMAQEGAMRRSAEDALVRALSEAPRVQSGQLQVTPSYEVLEQAELGDVDRARAKVEAQGYDGMVITSFVSSEERVSVDPGSYAPMWGYYGRRGVLYDPGSVRSDTIIRVQTNIYSVADGKLLWSGVSRTMNPRSVESLAKDVFRDVVGTLRKQGLLPPAA